MNHQPDGGVFTYDNAMECVDRLPRKWFWNNRLAPRIARETAWAIADGIPESDLMSVVAENMKSPANRVGLSKFIPPIMWTIIIQLMIEYVVPAIVEWLKERRNGLLIQSAKRRNVSL